MKINLSPQLRYDTLTASVSGDVITVNGEDFDFSFMDDGDTTPKDAIASEWIIDDVHKNAGEIELTLLFPVRGTMSDAAKFPSPLTVVSGNVEFPT